MHSMTASKRLQGGDGGRRPGGGHNGMEPRLRRRADQQALAQDLRIGVGVVGGDAALVGEGDGDVRPVDAAGFEAVVHRAGRTAAGPDEAGGAAGRERQRQLGGDGGLGRVGQRSASG
jgi:hypothetical protein